jgi:hypothetical protein
MSQLPDKIIERIEQEHVVPKPRWQFSLANQFFWSIWALSLLFAAAAAGAMMFALANAGWEFRGVTHDSFFSYLVDVLPVFWIAALIIFVLVAYENMKRTKLGYRYPIRLMLGIGLIGSLLAGGFFYLSGLGENLDQNIGQHIPLHRPALQAQSRIWVNPAKGLLGGEVTQADARYTTFTIRTFDGSVWIIDGDELGAYERDVLLNERPVIRVIGYPGTATTTMQPPVFHACMIFPWEVKGAAKFGKEPGFSVFTPGIPVAGQKVTFHNPVTIPFDQRITTCKGLRPYDSLMWMRESNTNGR